MTVVCIADGALLCSSGEPIVLIGPGSDRCGGGGRSAGDGLGLAPAVVRFRHQGSEQSSQIKAIPQNGLKYKK